MRCPPQRLRSEPEKGKGKHKQTQIVNQWVEAFVKVSARQRHTILDMRYTHWFALRQGGVAGLVVAFALWLAGEGRSPGGLEAAAAETVSAGNAQQHPEVGNVLADRRPERDEESRPLSITFYYVTERCVSPGHPSKLSWSRQISLLMRNKIINKQKQTVNTLNPSSDVTERKKKEKDLWFTVVY